MENQTFADPYAAPSQEVAVVESVDNTLSQDSDIKEEITLESLAKKLDIIGAQTDWICESLTSLFGFVQAMGQSGGGIRGLLKMMKQEAPEIGEQPNV